MKKINIILAQFCSFSIKSSILIRDFFTDAYINRKMAEYDKLIKQGTNDFRNLEAEFQQGLQAIAARNHNREMAFDKPTLQAAN